jgi:hypothetical protein
MQVFFIWQNAVLLIFGIWLIVVSVILIKEFALFKKLTKGVEETNLNKILEKLLAQELENGKNIGSLAKKISILDQDGKLHIQKVGLVRFNPFKELGGDHSFSLAILDGEGSGVVITSLHARDRTRVYMKKIVKGKSETEFSEEENKALAKAK